jgi:prepilin-type N-terminal cleavage/methylation domain-containing protein
MFIRRAFTLVELMVVIAIIAFLAVISVPQYFSYITRAKQMEVNVNLASLHTAMQTYYAENGKYTTILSGEGGIGWKPEGYKGGGSGEKFYYTYGFNFPGAQEGVHFFTGKLGTPKEALGETFADYGRFIAKAAADIGGKQKMDVWQVTNEKDINNVEKGL